MRRKIWLFVVVISALSFASEVVLARNGSVLSFSAGYMNPKDTKGGLIAGAGMGVALDESVDLGLAIDFFHKNYTQESEVSQVNQQGMSSSLYVTEVEYTRTILPVMLTVNVKIPTSRYFGYFIRGGLGYQFLFSKEKNYEENIEDSRNFSGLGWKFATGVFYHIGSRSTLVANALYNSCEVNRDVDESHEGLPVKERVDLSGLGFRVGVSVDIY
jgi:hypothetical protein